MMQIKQVRITIIVFLNKLIKNYKFHQMLRLSTLLSPFRESFNLRGKATFWFGGIIAMVSREIENSSDLQIKNDLETLSYCELIQILNHTLVSAIQFYPQSPPDSFYKFITFCNQLLTSAKNDNSQQKDFNVVLGKLTLRNSLIIHSFTIKQYAYVFTQCHEIMKQFTSSPIDTYNQCYLTFFSNFLTLTKKVQPSKRNYLQFNKLRESLEYNLNLVFEKILQKMSRIVHGQGSIDLSDFQLLSVVYFKNKTVLEKKQNMLYELIQSVVSQTKYKSLKGNVFVARIYKEKIEKETLFNFQIPFYEFNHFCQSQKFEVNARRVKKQLSTKEETDKEEDSRLQRIQKMLQQTISSQLNASQAPQQVEVKLEPVPNASLPGNKFRRLNYLSNKRPQAIESSRTIDVSSLGLNTQTFKSTELQNESSLLSSRRIPNFSIRHQVTQEMISPIKTQRAMLARGETKKIPMINQSLFFSNLTPGITRIKNSMHHVLNFKMGSIFIEVNDDGIILSDYTKENKRYVQWNTVSAIMLRCQYKFVYSEYLKYPLFNYYDVIRVLKLYLSKAETGSIGIFQYPNTILELNQFVRFYPQDGKYTKLVHMNIYDNTKLQGAIDCYFQQFDHFFKVVSTNGYLNYLSSKIFSDMEPQTNKNQVFYLQVLRKQKQSTRTQLQNQLTVDVLQSVTNDKDYEYRAIFILKNNSRTYAKICPAREKKDNLGVSQNQFFEISVRRLDNKPNQEGLIAAPTSSTRSLELPYYKIHQYIPLYDMSINTYAQRFGRMIFELFNNFEGLAQDMNMSTLQFEVITHFYHTQMIEIGKYYTVVSAELIGTKTQVFGLVIRYGFLPTNKEVITFLINPYHRFLANFITLSKDDKRNCFKKLLVQQSVKETYLYLQRTKKLNQISSLIEYLSEAIGFF